MPFTISHAAAVLPLMRHPFIPVGLVVGSVVPDLYSFVPGLPVLRSSSHSLLFAVTVNLGLGFALVLLWWLLLRAPMTDAAPARLRGRLSRCPMGLRTQRHRSGLTALVWLLLSLLIGNGLHLLWDSVTHEGWLVRQTPWLNEQLGPFTVVMWFQHVSTAGGLLVLAWWLRRWMRRTPLVSSRLIRSAGRISTSARAGLWGGLLAVMVTVGLLVLQSWQHSGFLRLDEVILFNVVVRSMGAGMVYLLGYCLLWWLLPPLRDAVRGASMAPGAEAGAADPDDPPAKGALDTRGFTLPV